jgi:N-acetylglucosamine kinase-like BadF-type ATPase
MPLFLGVDGGQSGTAAVIGDETGRVLGTGEAGPCNHAAAGEGSAKLERAITGSLAAACAEAGLDPATVSFDAACFGMSGGPEDKQEILAELIRARRLIVTTDAVIALAGATSTGQGIITIAGTGSIAFGRNAAGQCARAGGWGHIFGDEGGGFDIARQATRAMLRAEEGWGPSTRLRETLLEATGTHSANEMLHLFYADTWPRSRVAKLARLVDAAAVDSDPVAVDVLNNAAQELALFTGAVRQQLWAEGAAIQVAYIGGVFESTTLRSRFQALVELADGVTCGPPLRGPAEGALLEAIRAAC